MITLEQMDQMRKRTNCSYEEAKFFLEKHNGDVLEAIVDFERSKNNAKYSSYGSQNFGGKKQANDFWQSVTNLVKKGFENRVVIEDKNNVLINIPVNIVLIFIIFVSYLAVPAILILLLLGYKISIRKPQGEEVDISSMVQDMKCGYSNQNKNQQSQPQDVTVRAEEQKDDYNEITIE